MKKISILFILAAIIISPLAAQQKTSSGIRLTSAVDSACYAIGMSHGLGLRDQMATFPGGQANFHAVAEAFLYAITGDIEALQINPELAQAFLQAYIMEATTKDAEAAKIEEALYLAENKTREGVITTESGLQYKVVKQGEGEKPTIDDIVTVHYIGILLDGTIFQSSYERGEPLTMGVTQFISGWAEGLQLMPVGSTYVFWIPSELAYGEQGKGRIKPNTMLIFEVVLLSFEK